MTAFSFSITYFIQLEIKTFFILIDYMYRKTKYKVYDQQWLGPKSFLRFSQNRVFPITCTFTGLFHTGLLREDTSFSINRRGVSRRSITVDYGAHFHRKGVIKHVLVYPRNTIRRYRK